MNEAAQALDVRILKLPFVSYYEPFSNWWRRQLPVCELSWLKFSKTLQSFGYIHMAKFWLALQYEVLNRVALLSHWSQIALSHVMMRLKLLGHSLCAKQTFCNNSGLFRAIVIKRSYCWPCRRGELGPWSKIVVKMVKKMAAKCDDLFSMFRIPPSEIHSFLDQLMEINEWKGSKR